MKVRVIKEHHNVFGAQRRKDVDDTYDVPEDQARSLIASGHVVEDKGKSVKPKATAKKVAGKRKPAPKSPAKKTPVTDGEPGPG
ncbi:hypothetical protein KNJ79_02065 [Sphingopyxis indica]|uniref:hypothetical protein n=1 Tax=Sphingopyxis indica TaxID=436663 RepID=UPI0029390F57|nr:hypothetical protein [Sphingopyxis indica]WOF43773.1 hypothetical protein KNJ79_02065 [Sphingopyxis indica]